MYISFNVTSFSKENIYLLFIIIFIVMVIINNYKLIYNTNKIISFINVCIGFFNFMVIKFGYSLITKLILLNTWIPINTRFITMIYEPSEKKVKNFLQENYPEYKDKIGHNKFKELKEAGYDYYLWINKLSLDFQVEIELENEFNELHKVIKELKNKILVLEDKVNKVEIASNMNTDQWSSLQNYLSCNKYYIIGFIGLGVGIYFFCQCDYYKAIVNLFDFQKETVQNLNTLNGQVMTLNRTGWSFSKN